MIKKLIIIIIIIILAFSCKAYAATYYIDWVGGNDSNNGTSKSTPWKHAPGMNGVEAGTVVKTYQDTHSSTNSYPGTAFIFKGGVTWPNSAFTWNYRFGGGTGWGESERIYFGVDKTWYSGASWSRPIMDLESLPPTPDTTPGTGYGGMIRFYKGTNGYFVVDDIEFTGMRQIDDLGTGGSTMVNLQTTKFEVKNCYFHGWSHGGTATKEQTAILYSNYTVQVDYDSTIHHNIFDGTDNSQVMARAYRGSAGHFYNNYVKQMYVGLFSFTKYIWGNTFIDIGVSTLDITGHADVIENNGANSIIYNNYIDHSYGGSDIYTYGIDGAIDYIFNNVIVNEGNQAIQLSAGSIITGVGSGTYTFNNTIQTTAGILDYPISAPAPRASPKIEFTTARNNHLIATNPVIGSGGWVITEVQSNTVAMSNAQATSANYVFAGIYPYYPSANGPTVDTGYDMSSVCAGISDNGASHPSTACLSDTTLGVSYDDVNHTVSYPSKTPIARYTWDVGAYEYYVSGDATFPTVDTLSIPESITYLNKFTVSWTCSDAVGVTGQKWRANAVPNASNGTALATSPETISGILVSGDNDIYVGCYDAAGNYGTAKIPALKYVPSTFYGVSLN